VPSSCACSSISKCQCGNVREVKIIALPNVKVATVEFFDRVSTDVFFTHRVRHHDAVFLQDSVPAALTKDKRRLHGSEIAVHLAWRSTLYVTNFPAKVDDAFVRYLFGQVGFPWILTSFLPVYFLAQYGTLFDVRWPSKKFNASRRFCYVQFVSPVRLSLVFAIEAFAYLHQVVRRESA
jgi:squamous cell carcinoma antigen recognized by T-cells 3